MTPYLIRIREYLIARYRMKPGKAVDGREVWHASRRLSRSGGKINFHTDSRRRMLTYHPGEKAYMEFREEVITRIYKSRRRVFERIILDGEHFTVNGDGSIRRRYTRDRLRGRQVRAISLRNIYQLPDEKLAKLLLYTDEDHAWVLDLPFCFHPVSNKELAGMTSYAAYLAHFLGEGVAVPARLQAFLPPDELHKLIQIVPGNYLGTLASVLKQYPAIRKRPSSVHQILFQYYKSTLVDPGHGLSQTVRAYTNCCRGMGLKVNLQIRSQSRLAAEFNKLRRRRKFDQLPELTTDPLLILPNVTDGPLRLELIHNKRRLLREAKRMQSCVDTYGRDVNKGYCALYHVTYRGRPYTLEIRRNDEDKLYVSELLGVKNRVPVGKVRQLVEKFLK